MRLGRRQLAVTVIGAVTFVAVGLGAAAEPAGSAERSRGRDSERSRRSRHPDDNAATPARFVAEHGGRLVVVSAETGRIERVLTAPQPGGGAHEPALTADGRAVWFSRADGTCAAHLASVPTAGGAEQRLPGSGEAGPEGNPLPRPGRAQVAFARTDCDDGGGTLVIGDLKGLEGYGQTDLRPLAWSRDGDHLLAATTDGAEVRLLDINDRGSIVAQQPLAPTDRTPECRLQVVGFSPDANDGYVAVRRCGTGGSTRRSLVLLDRRGAYRQTVVRLPRGADFVDRPAFDATGHSLLYTSSSSPDLEDGAAAKEPEISLWLWRDGDTRVVARGSRYRRPSWLP